MVQTVKSLFRHAKNTPLLTADQEIELGRSIQLWLKNELRIATDDGYIHTDVDRQIAKTGKSALQKLVGSNLRLVISTCRRLYGAYEKRHSFDDLMQAGILGLDRAARRYDPTRGYRFSTYAMDWIRQQINLYHEENSRGVRLPAHQYTRHSRIRRAIRSLKENGDSPSIAQIAEQVGEKPDFVSGTLALFAKESSLDMLIPGTEFCLLDNLSDPKASDMERVNLYEVVKQGIDEMPVELSEVLVLNFFGGMSIRQIAEQKGVQPAVLRYRYKKGLNQLRQLVGVNQ